MKDKLFQILENNSIRLGDAKAILDSDFNETVSDLLQLVNQLEAEKKQFTIEFAFHIYRNRKSFERASNDLKWLKEKSFPLAYEKFLTNKTKSC